MGHRDLDWDGLPMFGLNSTLSEEQAARADAAPLGFLGPRIAYTRFDEPNGANGYVTKEVIVTVPEGTQKVVLSLGNWYFQFGPSDNPIERPLGHIGMVIGFGGLAGRTLTVVIRAWLRDADGSEPWSGRVQVMVQCFG